MFKLVGDESLRLNSLNFLDSVDGMFITIVDPVALLKLSLNKVTNLLLMMPKVGTLRWIGVLCRLKSYISELSTVPTAAVSVLTFPSSIPPSRDSTSSFDKI
jgi:hypothetical protein